MFGIQYFKADASTYVIRTRGGRLVDQGLGLSFWYNAVSTSIAAIPMNVQEAPFIFALQTADYQELSVQGQVSFRIEDPAVIAGMLNFTVRRNGQAYVSEDPVRLGDQVVRMVQAIVQGHIRQMGLRDALGAGQELVGIIRDGLADRAALAALGIGVVDVTIAAVQPLPETARALEAEAREAILKEADDAIYARRKSAVEQERTIREAELKTELIVQQKEQEIAESRIANDRAILRGTNETETERLAAKIRAERDRQAAEIERRRDSQRARIEEQREGMLAEIETENRRSELVERKVANGRQEADLEAYAMSVRMQAFRELPVENLKALALGGMNPEQLMALAFEALAQNADRIGELNITPDMFGRFLQKAAEQ